MFPLGLQQSSAADGRAAASFQAPVTSLNGFAGIFSFMVYYETSLSKGSFSWLRHHRKLFLTGKQNGEKVNTAQFAWQRLAPVPPHFVPPAYKEGPFKINE